jgi:hypothetical protein
MEVRPAIDVAPVRREYEQVAALATAESRAVYVAAYLDERGGRSAPAAADVAAIVKALDARGAWVSDQVRVHPIEPIGTMNSGDTQPIRGVSSGGFVRNLGALASYVAGLAK